MLRTLKGNYGSRNTQPLARQQFSFGGHHIGFVDKGCKFTAPDRNPNTKIIIASNDETHKTMQENTLWRLMT